MLVLTLGLGLASPQASHAQSRIKDIVNIEGIRDNQLVGYGLVVGLNGTGDSINNTAFTRESLIGMLERLGINGQNASLGSKNIAAVMVTATLPPFARQGNKLDVSVSTMGNASSLQGGTLLVTPLMGADGEVYIVAQGTVAAGGYNNPGVAEVITRGVPTAGRIASGGIVEKEIGFDFASLPEVKLGLRNPDFTTARRIVRAVNSFIGSETSSVLDPGTVLLKIPANYKNRLVELITDVEALRIEPDAIAKVVIDEQTGTIVMGENVRISRVAIAQGNLTIKVSEQPTDQLPQPFNNQGGLATNSQTNQSSTAKPQDANGKNLGVMGSSVTLQELVNGLNSLGVKPHDMITILQVIKAAGALQADIEIL